MLLGLVLGAAGGGAAGYRIGVKKNLQRQTAGDNASQMQAGRDIKDAKQ